MKVIVKCGNNTKVFEGKSTVVISGNTGADFIIPQVGSDDFIKLIFVPKYNNYVLVNLSNDKEILCNDKNFSKVLVTPKFNVSSPKLPVPIEFTIEESSQTPVTSIQTAPVENDIEKQRVAIIKEIGYRVVDLKNYSKSASVTGMFLNAAMAVLSVVSSFAVTNYLLGLTVDSSESVLNLSTNFWFLGGISVVVFAISLILRQSIASLLEFHARPTKRYFESPVIQRFIILITSLFMFVVYVMNLLYYKEVEGPFAAVFISLLFAGALATVAVGSGYFKHQYRTYQQELTECEFREDFENVLKDAKDNLGKKEYSFKANISEVYETNVLVDGNNVDVDKENLELYSAYNQSSAIIQKLNSAIGNLRYVFVNANFK
jgi:hypothetical protein